MIRDAILKAADTIERNPQLFRFVRSDIPDDCGSPGCALGWIGFYLGAKPIVIKDRHGQDLKVCDIWHSSLGDVARDALGLQADSLDAEENFYEMLSDFEPKWLGDAAACARALRRYADVYYPVAKAA